MEQLIELLVKIPFVAVMFIFLWLGKWFYDLTTPYRFAHELTERDNTAFGAHLGLYLIGLLFALGGTLYGGIAYTRLAFIAVVVFSLLAVLLVRLSVWLNDKLILGAFDINKEMIHDRNLGTGLVVGGGCVATGLTINGALSGESALSTAVYDPAGILWLGRACFDVVVYFLVGQALLVVGAWVFRGITTYNAHEELEKHHNIAVGLAFGGFLVGLGIIVRASLVGAGPDLVIEVLRTLAIAAAGLILLVGGRLLTDRVILPSGSLYKEVAVDRNPAAGAVAASVSISLALAFGYVITARSL